jgi:hypothetical protein
VEPNIVVNVVHGTPPWVFALLAVLVGLGLLRLRPRVRRLRTVWLTPAIFIVWGLAGLRGPSGTDAELLGRWLTGAAAGVLLGLAFAVPLQADRTHRLVRLPGSVVPLLRYLAIFFAHYLLRAGAAAVPGEHATLMAWDTVVSGVSAGYFAGWATRFARGYARAPAIDLGERRSAVQPVSA